MATTTNYGWTTPDDTALVKDGAAAIRSLGTSVDTTTKNLNPSTTLGDIEYRSSTANTNTRLGIGSTGQVLTVAGGVPSWATTVASVPNNASALTTTAESTTSSSYTGLTTATSVTLTTGTKALVAIFADARNNTGAEDFRVSFAVSGATTIAASDNYSALRTIVSGSTGENRATTIGRTYIITGLTAGSNTFTMQYRQGGGTSTFANRSISVMDMGS